MYRSRPSLFHVLRTGGLWAVTASMLCAPVAHAALVPGVFGGRIACSVAGSGVQFCEGDVTTRIESFDGVPLDVNVTLPPAAMSGPFPLIIEMHGWSGSKSSLPSVDRALAGYVVLNYTARGFHESCGTVASRASDPGLSDPDACADRGWTHLADVRYEGRDSQYLAGLLVDEGLVIPDRIGATGVSYGGGRSMMLAVLKNRVMLTDGTLVPWTSPMGTPMEMAAAAPLIPWSDLGYALVPNGATLDYRDENPYGDRAGVFKDAWNSTLLGTGAAVGYYAPLGFDPEADLLGWDARLRAGEPYDNDPFLIDMRDQIAKWHSAYYLVDAVEPAPLFIYNAWTDDLFPANEGLRIWRKVLAEHPGAEVDLHFADAFGHPRASLVGDTTRVATRIDEFFDYHLKGTGSPIPTIEVYTQACGGSTETGPITGADWDALQNGEVVLTDATEHRLDSGSGRLTTADDLAPLAGGPCRTFTASDDPGAANYHVPAATAGYTLLGSPTVIADFVVGNAEFARVDARLWEISPGGQQALISHGVFRPRSDAVGPQVFQLPANAWQVQPGYSLKLELLGRSSPSFLDSRLQFSVAVSNVELRLPVLESPDGDQIATTAARVLPPVDTEPPTCPSAPLPTCRTSTRSGGAKLVVKANGGNPKGNKLSFKLGKGEATDAAEFEAALTNGGYSLCVYGNDSLYFSAKAVTGSCGSSDCWSIDGDQLSYEDKKASRAGTAKARLTAGAEGDVKVQFQAKGARTGLPSPSGIGLPLTVQLIDRDDACWGAEFDTPKKISATSLVAKSN
jgi:hypothetical protein